MFRWDENRNISQQGFITGLDQNGDVMGRPVDMPETADGTSYISAKDADVIYNFS